jgi:RimJ/RimL family protein N-acetyltransferase
MELLDAAKHLDDLHEAFGKDRDGRLWTYMPVGPFPSKQEFAAWISAACRTDDPLFYAIKDSSTGSAVGVAALMRIKPDIGVIEVGHITCSPYMQRTAMSTEAMVLLMTRVFDELGYRRYEWKCDSLNAASRQAAERLGFRFEGVFEQATIYKGRNRDTAWYSILDRDWPALKRAYLQWLDDSNFDKDGRQKRRLQAFTELERARASEEAV